MANPEHLELLKRGVQGWNHWRGKSLEFPDLSGADLGRENLREARRRRKRRDGDF